jgi:hypothetical protein
MDNKKHGLKHSCHRCPLFLLAQEAQKKKKQKENAAFVGRRPTPASFLKKARQKLQSRFAKKRCAASGMWGE